MINFKISWQSTGYMLKIIDYTCMTRVENTKVIPLSDSEPSPILSSVYLNTKTYRS